MEYTSIAILENLIFFNNFIGIFSLMFLNKFINKEYHIFELNSNENTKISLLNISRNSLRIIFFLLLNIYVSFDNIEISNQVWQGDIYQNSN